MATDAHRHEPELMLSTKFTPPFSRATAHQKRYGQGPSYKRLLAHGVLTFALALSPGCSDSKSAGTAQPGNTLRTQAYAAPAIGSDGSVNAYFVETAHGIVVIDGLRTLHEAQAGLLELQKRGKPVLAAILTHSHPDHVGGLGVFVGATGNSIPVYGSRETEQEIETDAHGYFKLSVSTMSGDFPETVTRPTHIVEDGDRVTIDDVELVFHELGVGESVSATVVVVPSAKLAFVGDLTSNHMTPYLVEGRTQAWLSQLDTLASELEGIERVYPGHGRESSVAEAISQERDYLTTFRTLIIQNRTAQGTVDEAGRTAITAAMAAKFSDYPPVATIPDLFNKNIDAVAQELTDQ